MPRHDGLRLVLDRTLVLLALLAVWQALFGMVGGIGISSPYETVLHAGQLLQTSQFWRHLAASGAAFLYALVISWSAGVVVGLALGFHRFSGAVAEPLLSAFYTIPKITLYPLILLIFGLGISAKVAFGVIHGVIPVILFTMNAVRTLNPVYTKLARVMKLTPAQTAATILAPAVIPEIITGMRVGFSLTMLGVLVGEMFASQQGLGFLIVNGMNTHDIPTITAVIFLLVILAIVTNTTLLALERRLHRSGTSSR